MVQRKSVFYTEKLWYVTTNTDFEISEEISHIFFFHFAVAQRSTSFRVKDIFPKCWSWKLWDEREAIINVCRYSHECNWNGRSILCWAAATVLYYTHFIFRIDQSLPENADRKKEAVGFSRFHIIQHNLCYMFQKYFSLSRDFVYYSFFAVLQLELLYSLIQ